MIIGKVDINQSFEDIDRKIQRNEKWQQNKKVELVLAAGAILGIFAFTIASSYFGSNLLVMGLTMGAVTLPSMFGVIAVKNVRNHLETRPKFVLRMLKDNIHLNSEIVKKIAGGLTEKQWVKLVKDLQKEKLCESVDWSLDAFPGYKYAVTKT